MFAQFNLGHSWSSQRGSKAKESSAAHFYGFREDIDTDKIQPYLHLVSAEHWPTRQEVIDLTCKYFAGQVKEAARLAGCYDVVENSNSRQEKVRVAVEALRTDPFAEPPFPENQQISSFSMKWCVGACTGNPTMAEDIRANKAFRAKWIEAVAQIATACEQWIEKSIAETKEFRKRCGVLS